MNKQDTKKPDQGIIIIPEKEALVEYTLHELKNLRRAVYGVLLFEIANFAWMIVQVLFNA